MTKKLILILIAVLIYLFVGCNNQNIVDSNNSEAKGRVIYLPFEGGFYGIETENKKYLDPINLRDEYKKDSLKIQLTYRERTDLASVHMWGKLIEIIEIKEIEK